MKQQHKALQLDADQPLQAPLTAEYFARLIGYNHYSVTRAIREGRIKAVKFGRTWRIHRAEAQRILQNGLPVEAE